MEPVRYTPNKNHPYNLLFYTLSTALQLGFLIIIPIMLFFFVGLYLDKYLLTTPLFLIIGITAGFGISFYYVYRTFKRLLSYHDKHKSAS